MVTERRKRELSGRRAVHECNGPKGRLAGRTARNRQSAARSDRRAPHGGHLHEQIVRMLPIDEGNAVQLFARLKEFAVPGLSFGRRVEAQHGHEPELLPANRPAGHAHPPIRRRGLPPTSRAALTIEQQIDLSVLQELPAGARLARHAHRHPLHLPRRVCGIDALRTTATAATATTAHNALHALRPRRTFGPVIQPLRDSPAPPPGLCLAKRAGLRDQIRRGDGSGTGRRVHQRAGMSRVSVSSAWSSGTRTRQPA